MQPNIPQYAGVILVRPDQTILMQQRDESKDIQNPGTVSFFGGAVEADEQPIQAALRELREELQLELQPEDLALFGTYMKTIEKHGVDRECYIYLAKISDEMQLHLREGQSIVRVGNQEELARLQLSALASEVLHNYYASR